MAIYQTLYLEQDYGIRGRNRDNFMNNFSIGEGYSTIEVSINDFGEFECKNEEFQMSFVLDNVVDIIDKIDNIKSFIDSSSESVAFNEFKVVKSNGIISFIDSSYFGSDYPLKLSIKECNELFDKLRLMVNKIKILYKSIILL